jgi:NodT family efflux transporter outer membrane factor (OMF) lipoprotein
MSTSAASRSPAPAARPALGIVAVAALAAACAVGPDFVRPPPLAVGRYRVAPAAEPDGVTLAPDWWRLFGSPALDALVARALAASPTLAAAEHTLRASEERLRAGHGLFAPTVTLAADADRERAVPVVDGTTGAPSIFNVFTAGGSIGYLLDVFGGARRTVEALHAGVDYQRCLARAAALTLAADVVDTAIARAAADAEREATVRLLVVLHLELDATRAAVEAGTTPYADILVVRASLAAAEVALAGLRQRLSASEDLLATLTGVAPAAAMLPDIPLASLVAPAHVPLVVPSRLAHRRPDILASEALLHAASANIGVATAAMFPALSLAGSYGGTATAFGELTDAGQRFWAVGPALAVPLFQGGALWHQRGAALETFRAAQASYRATVLAGFAQVADSLAALDNDAAALVGLEDARRAAADNLGLVRVAADAGLVAELAAYVAEAALRQAEVAAFAARATRAEDSVALVVALGGGWAEPAAALADPAP